jgi:ABC-type transporter Mla MlaB component
LAAPETPPPAFVHAVRLPHDADAILLVIGGRIARADAVPLGDQARELLDGSRASLAICDVGMLDQPGGAAVDLLCRIRLLTRRMAMRLEIRAPSRDLSELLFLTGLCDVVAGPGTVRPRSGGAARRVGTSGPYQERT